MLDLNHLSQRYLAAQLAADRHEAIRLIVEDGSRRGASVADLLMDVIMPAQREIGRLWQENRITVADEHLATAISQVAVAQLYGLARREEPRGKRLLVACVEGEQHDLGARIAADLLDLDGYEVQFAGANVPVDSLVALVAKHAPHLVALSATMTFHRDALRRSVRALREQVAPDLPIAAGGHALQGAPDLVAELGLAATGADARELVANVNRYFQS